MKFYISVAALVLTSFAATAEPFLDKDADLSWQSSENEELFIRWSQTAYIFMGANPDTVEYVGAAFPGLSPKSKVGSFTLGRALAETTGIDESKAAMLWEELVSNQPDEIFGDENGAAEIFAEIYKFGIDKGLISNHGDANQARIKFSQQALKTMQSPTLQAAMGGGISDSSELCYWPVW